MKTAIVRAKVEPELKKEAEEILRTIGLSTARAINLLLHQIVLTKGLPLELYIPSARVENNIRKAKAGHVNDAYNTADDALQALKERQCLPESPSTPVSKRPTKSGKRQATI